MKTFKELYEACCAACEKRAEIEEVKEPTGDLKDACWKGYTAVGMKMKNGRKVPNCVPVKEEIEIDEATVARHGLTSIEKKKDHYQIVHTGNMANTVKNSVEPNVDKMLGRGAFAHMKKAGKAEGSPDYLYTMKVPKDHFHSWLKKVQEEVEQIDEMDKTQSQQGGHGVTEPYDYDKGKWSKARIMTNKEVAKKVKFDVGKLLKIARDKKKIKEEVELDEGYMMAAAASANQPQYKERTPEEEKKHAERKAEKYLHMPGKNAAKKRKYWVKKVNKLHGIPEEVEQIDEISKDLATRYMRQIERQPGLDKDNPEKREPKKFGSQKIGYERAFNKVSPYGKHRVKIQATEENQKGKNVVPPHVGALATGGIVKEEDGDNKPLGKVMRAGDGKKKFKVYVKNAKGNVVKVGFGDPNMEIKRDDPERRKNFRARHNCDTATDRTTPRYWSCKMWTAKPVSDITK